MRPIQITKDILGKSLLSRIEDEVKKYEDQHILISFDTSLANSERKKQVELVKKHFNLFIILKTELPSEAHIIEEYFSYGIHGVYFDLEVELSSKEDFHLLSFAAELFPSGWVFSSSQADQKRIEDLLALKVIPVLQEESEQWVQFIKSHEDFTKISRHLIKSVPLLDKSPKSYSLTEKIKMKMLLETLNLRQKLMVKSIDESFNSSGL